MFPPICRPVFVSRFHLHCPEKWHASSPCDKLPPPASVDSEKTEGGEAREGFEGRGLKRSLESLDLGNLF